ncbi:MAG: hypothetical protein M3Q73_03455 [bacterium]|nr:hypothetical protein [bacterium]
MSLLFSNKGEQTIALFDIGNGSIGASIVKLSKKDLPTILYSYREPITFMPQATQQKLMENMLKILKSICGHMQKDIWPQYHRNVKHAYCVFSAPWFVAETRDIKYEKDALFDVSQALVEDILRKDEKAFTDSLIDGNYEKTFGIKLHILEKKIIHTKLNGYEVHDFLYKKAKQLEITLFTSFMSDTIPTSVEAVLRQYFHFNSVNFNSYAMASWYTLQSMFPLEQHHLLLDISAEMTDIMLTEYGMVRSIVSFPEGKSLVLRKIVEELAVPPEVALSFLQLYNRGAVEAQFADKMNIIIKNCQEIWRTQFFEALKSLKNYTLMPAKVFITADNDIAQAFIDSLKLPVPAEFDVPQNTFDVVFLGSDVVHPFAKKVQPGPVDVFIALESAFLNKIIL